MPLRQNKYKKTGRYAEFYPKKIINTVSWCSIII